MFRKTTPDVHNPAQLDYNFPSICNKFDSIFLTCATCPRPHACSFHLHRHAYMTCTVSSRQRLIIPPSKPEPACQSAHGGLKGRACLRRCPTRITGPGASQQPVLMTCSQQIPVTLRWLPPTRLRVMMKRLR